MDRKTKVNILFSASYQILTILIPLITTPYLSRVLGPTGIGEYTFAYSVASYFIMFVMLGLTNYGNRTIAAVRDNKAELCKEFWSIYYMQLICAFVMIVLYLLYAFVLTNDIMARILTLSVASAAIDISWFFFGMEQFKLTVTKNTIIKLLSTISIFLLVKSEKDIYIYALIMVASMFVSQLVLWPHVKKNIVFVPVSLTDIRKHIKPNLVLFVPVIAVSIYKTMDKIMLGWLTDEAQVGFYESAERVIAVPMALIVALGNVMLPKMTNMIANSQEEDSKKYLHISIMLAMFVSAAAGFGLMGIAKPFVPLFFGNGYELCILLFQFLLPSCMFLAFSNVIRTQYIIPNSLDKVFIQSVFLGALVNAVFNYLLIGKAQAVGAAIGTLMAEATVCIYQMFALKKVLPIRRYIKDSMPVITAGMGMWICLSVINIYYSPGVFGLVVEIFIGAVLFFLFLVVYVAIIKPRGIVDALKAIKTKRNKK